MTSARSLLERIGDRVPVPQPAFDRLDRRRARIQRDRRIAAGAVGAIVFVAMGLALSAALRGGARVPMGESPTPSIDVTFGPRHFAKQDLPSIIIGADEAPSCTGPYGESRGPNAFFQIEGPQGYVWDERLIEAAWSRNFYDYLPDDASCGSPHGKVYIKVFGAVFSSNDAAADEMGRYLSNVTKTWGWLDISRSDDTGLGQNGVILEGRATEFDYVLESGTHWGERQPGVFLLWRINNLVLLTTAAGDYDLGEMRALADLMTARADACSFRGVGERC